METLPLTNRPDSWITLVCPICSQAFIKTHNSQKYCSRECYRRSKYKPVEKPPQTPSQRAQETRGSIYIDFTSVTAARDFKMRPMGYGSHVFPHQMDKETTESSYIVISK